MTIPTDNKANVYKLIKIGGLLSFIPFILVSGPLAGYFLGDYLEKKFGMPHWALAATIGLGFAGSAREAIRVLKAALRSEKEMKE